MFRLVQYRLVKGKNVLYDVDENKKVLEGDLGEKDNDFLVPSQYKKAVHSSFK